jgi:predicted dehydrogenase
MTLNRRWFIGSAVMAAVRTRGVSAADKVNIAIMGVRGRGRALAGAFAQLPDVHISTFCEVDPRVVAAASAVVEKSGRTAPKVETDLRRVLDDKSIDAIVVAAPDHWHAPATILACQAGKDVYVEKPASHNLREGRLMVDAARRHRRIVQLGTQGRSRAHVIEAVEYARSGRIGKVLAAKAWNVQLRDNIGHEADAPVPPGVDYEAWTGPAKLLPFNENRFHYKWHWHWNYGTGDIGNDGIHQIDIARWALDVGAPLGAAGSAGKLFFDDDQQTPDTATVTFRYPENKTLIFEMRIWAPYGMEGVDNGVAVYGSQGMVQIGRWNRAAGWRVFDAKGKMVEQHDEKAADGQGEGRGDGHARDFIDCIRSRKAPRAEIAIGHASTVHVHLANIVARTGRHTRFDPQGETIAGDAEANRLLRREYRSHWAALKV